MTALVASLATMVVEPAILGVIDRILLDLHAGHALIGLFVLVMLAALPLKSRKVLSINLVAFGAIFILTPFWVVEQYELYLISGFGMIFIGTMLYVFSES